jgi:hypothetical protein
MEEVSENRNTFATHRNAKCPLKYTFTKYNEYIVKQIFEHFDMSFRELFGKYDACFINVRKTQSIQVQGDILAKAKKNI